MQKEAPLLFYSDLFILGSSLSLSDLHSALTGGSQLVQKEAPLLFYSDLFILGSSLSHSLSLYIYCILREAVFGYMSVQA